MFKIDLEKIKLIIILFSQGLYAFVGSHESINPRHFRLLLSDGPVPSVISADRDTTLAHAGLPAFCVVIGENLQVIHHNLLSIG